MSSSGAVASSSSPPVGATWARPLEFSPLGGWHTGASGTLPSRYGPASVRSPKESTGWIATKNIRYRNRATADPPNKTLAHLPRDGVIVWAVIYNSLRRSQTPIRLDLVRAKRFDCCEGAYVPSGDYELTGAGPGDRYSVIVRIYFGTRPTRSLRAQAQQALDALRLPLPR